MIEDEELGFCQEAIVKAALYGSGDLSLQDLLLEDNTLSAQHSWIQSWEPRMGDLARVLTQKWAVEAD